MYNSSGLCRSYKSDDFEKMVTGAEYLKEVLADNGITDEAERYIFTRSIFFHRSFIMSNKSIAFKQKYREIKRLISLSAYNAMIAPEHFPDWSGTKKTYIKLAYIFQRKKMNKLYFMFLLFDKLFVAGK